MPVVKENQGPKSRKGVVYECIRPRCPFLLQNGDTYKGESQKVIKHMVMFHSHWKDAPFQCRLCQLGFGRQCDADHHGKTRAHLAKMESATTIEQKMWYVVGPKVRVWDFDGVKMWKAQESSAFWGLKERAREARSVDPVRQWPEVWSEICDELPGLA